MANILLSLMCAALRSAGSFPLLCSSGPAVGHGPESAVLIEHVPGERERETRDRKIANDLRRLGQRSDISETYVYKDDVIISMG